MNRLKTIEKTDSLIQYILEYGFVNMQEFTAPPRNTFIINKIAIDFSCINKSLVFAVIKS